MFLYTALQKTNKDVKFEILYSFGPNEKNVIYQNTNINVYVCSNYSKIIKKVTFKSQVLPEH